MEEQVGADGISKTHWHPSLKIKLQMGESMVCHRILKNNAATSSIHYIIFFIYFL